VDTVEVSTVVYLPPADVYEFLLDFPGYADYSTHLRDVEQRGDGGPGTAYALEFAWWKLSYTAHSRVTAVDPPTRIDWTLTEDIDANGSWLIEALSTPPSPPSRNEAAADALECAANDAEEPVASRVTLKIQCNTSTVDSSVLDLPPLVSFERVIQTGQELVVSEGERIVERIVADLEGGTRGVDLSVAE